jgi:hypothetical protein
MERGRDTPRDLALDADETAGLVERDLDDPRLGDHHGRGRDRSLRTTRRSRRLEVGDEQAREPEQDGRKQHAHHRQHVRIIDIFVRQRETFACNSAWHDVAT